MAGNNNLNSAREDKNDEFYTQLIDIENELKHYREQFANKIILCNCDDPYESNFFKYFALNFNTLKLKKLICTCYDGSPIIGEQVSFFAEPKILEIKKKAYRIELTNVDDFNCDGAIDLNDIEQILKSKKLVKQLNGNGDFRSEECIKLLKEADIVVTNPPFSLFREYIAQLIDYNKKFLIIGNQNSITCKEIFPLIKNNKMWLGYNSGAQTFRVPDYFSKNNTYVGEDNRKYAKFGNICWCTNLDVSKRHEKIILFKKYSPQEYPKYINYNAINVNKITDIPEDYYDEMGVPITFITSYSPEQFEITGISNHDAIRISDVVESDAEYQKGGPQVYLKIGNKKYRRLYNRIFIKRVVDKEED